MMLTEKEAVLLKHLRANSRKSLVQISKESNIPVSTLFDTLKKLEHSVVVRHVSLVDFAKLGYGVRVNFAVGSKNKKEIRDFLLNHPSVNSISSLIGGQDFYFECIFKNLKEMTEFKQELDKYELHNFYETFIVEELKKEGF